MSTALWATRTKRGMVVRNWVMGESFSAQGCNAPLSRQTDAPLANTRGTVRPFWPPRHLGPSQAFYTAFFSPTVSTHTAGRAQTLHDIRQMRLDRIDK